MKKQCCDLYTDKKCSIDSIVQKICPVKTCANSEFPQNWAVPELSNSTTFESTMHARGLRLVCEFSRMAFGNRPIWLACKNTN